MNTCKPISTVTYNTNEFLVHQLDILLKTHVIDYYMFINHLGEPDQYGDDKDHTHLFILPNHRINTADIDDLLIEPVEGNLPLRNISWSTSKNDDWILYNLHDPAYLLTKFETRKYQYSYDDLKSSNENDLRRRYRCAYQSSGYAKMKNLYQYAVSGGSIEELMKNGAIPVNQVSFYQDFFKLAKRVDLSY